MLKLKNCDIKNVVNELNNDRIIIFGTGNYFDIIQQTELSKLVHNVEYIVDNNPKAENIRFCAREIPLCYPDKLKDEHDCVVIITSPVYMYDMYQQLEQMELQGDIDCYCFPFMQMISKPTIDDKEIQQIYDNRDIGSIPKIIHSFWFSGDEKPDSYQKCVDTWKRVCPDYEIIEWNMDNYDWKKNAFCKHAIEVQAWAYASDYARLDVINQMGGIYLDMDVEVLKPFDDLLNNKGLFSFSNQVTIDLATFAAQKKNDLVQKMLELYEMQSVPETKKDYMSFFQPKYIQKVMVDYGLESNGELQVINGNVFLPRTFFMPMDTIVFEMSAQSEFTYSIHYDNFGWNAGAEDIRKKKIESNRRLWEMLGGK